MAASRFAGLFIFLLRSAGQYLFLFLFFGLFCAVSPCALNGTELSLRCCRDALSFSSALSLFNFGWSPAVNNASQPATCTVFIISMLPGLSVEYL